MRRWIFVLITVVLAGCAFSGVAPNAILSFEGPIAPKMEPGKAILAMGLNFVSRGSKSEAPNGACGAWIKIDPSSGFRDTSADVEFDIDNTILPSDAEDGTRYYFFSVPPGTYALGWIANQGHFFLSSDYEDIYIIRRRLSSDYHFSPVARAKAFAPSFTIGAGEVVYIDDLVGDFSQMARAKLSIRISEAEVRKRLSERGHKEAPTVRLFRQFDGKPFDHIDLIMATFLRS